MVTAARVEWCGLSQQWRPRTRNECMSPSFVSGRASDLPCEYRRSRPTVVVTLTGEVSMIWLLLCILPVASFVALDLICGGEPPAVVQRVRSAARFLGSRLPLVSRLARRSIRLVRLPCASRRPVHDVFDTLHVQSRLGAVADEILRLESDRLVFAKAARLRATHRAYDDLLAEACRLAEVRTAGDGVRSGDDARMHAELELASRGWSW